MKEKSIKKNYVYNLILTTLNLIFPLITAPYLSYVLGPDNIGKVNYATSIVNWFILIAAFGIPRYGIREIARNKKNKNELSNIFWNLLVIQLVLSLIAIIVYFFMIINIKSFNKDLSLYLIMVLMIIFNIFSIDWFYQGIEEYGYITIRNISVKIISIILIFLMIKNKNDFLLYAFINIIGLGFNNILNYFHTKRYIYKKVYKFRFKFYFSELKIYFFTTLVIALYTQIDQIFVGAHSTGDLAFYMRSKMVLNIGMSIVGSIVTVLIPRTAYLIANDYNKYKEILSESINYIYILAFPSFIGIFLLAKEIMVLLGGIEFIPATYSLKIISILVLITSIGSWQINQILLPHRRENLAFNTQFIIAILSLLLNIVFVPKFSYIGAAFIWVFVEIVLVIIEGVLIKIFCKDIKILYINKSMIKYIIASTVMAVSINFVKILFTSNIFIILFSVIIGSMVYFLTLIILKESIINAFVYQIIAKYNK